MLAAAIAETSTITITLAASIGGVAAGVIVSFVMLKARVDANTEAWREIKEDRAREAVETKRWRAEIDRWRYTEEGRALAVPRQASQPHEIAP